MKFKKIAAGILAAGMLSGYALFPNTIPSIKEMIVPAAAEFFDSDPYFACEYTVSDGRATITKYRGNGGDVVILDKLGDYSVAAIGDEAFYFSQVKNVTVPSGVTYIGEAAFCKSTLTGITMPEGVTYIGKDAFYGCSMTGVSVPNSVTAIGNSAFNGCESLTFATLSKGITHISNDLFAYCKSLKTLNVTSAPFNNNGIPNTGLSYFDTVTVKIPDGVVSIGDRAFFNCFSIERVTIPDSVTSIGVQAFSECIKLASVTIPKSVTSIGDGAFGISPDFIIYGYTGSCAEAYAKKENITFIALDAPSEEKETEINETNFPDALFRQYVSDNFDNDKNGKLSKAECEAVTEIRVYGAASSDFEKISTLKGIEYFTFLQTLVCSENKIAFLDVSKNTALKELYCNGNQLTSLDVSQNTDLEAIYCYDNMLTSLDVSKNTKLSIFYCQNNRLKSLDVSKNTKLSLFNCGNNQLTTIYISKNNSLYIFNFSYNQLTSLDVGTPASIGFDITNWEQVNNSYKINVENDKFDLSELPGNFDVNRASNWQGATYSDGKLINFTSDTITYDYDVTGKGWKIQFTLIAQAGSEIEINETNFPDTVFRKYVSNNFDTDKNNALSAAEIAAVTEINVPCDQQYYDAEPIFTLKGIEFFTALKKLVCIGNNISSLDMSRNTALTELDCRNNYPLTELDVSKNTALQKLDCSGCKLTELDVSSNTALTYLDCGYYNQLTKLDVSRNTALQELYCSDNKLTELDVSKNTALIKLECGGNYLANIDISSNTALELFVCSSRDITKLDISKNKALTHLDCGYCNISELDVSTAPLLKDLLCNGNNLTKLDLSRNKALESLNCNYNKLTALDLSSNTALKYLDCGDNKLTALDVSSNTALEYLNCRNNQLAELNISKNAALSELLCYQNKLTSLDVSKCSALERLLCNSNELTALDVSQNKALTSFDCESNKIAELNVSSNKALESLYCRKNDITELDLSKNRKLAYMLTDTTITIYGIAGSPVEEYALEKGIKFIAVAAPVPAVSGTITVSGKDETTEGVKVSITDANGKPCSVDIDLESGELSISGLSDGTYTLTITKSKYCPRDCTVTIADGQMTGELSVKLQKYGDIDNTGEINISDALQIVNYRNSKTSSFDKASGDDLKYLEKLADINNDGQVNINDALQIVNFRNGKASSFDKIA